MNFESSIDVRVPILGLVGFSGSGKTTLLVKVIQELKSRGIRIGVIKHAHHKFDIDHPGKDSYVLRHSGAVQTLVASKKRWALMTETTNRDKDPQLGDLLTYMDLDQLDMVLVEGFKHAPYPKLEVHRSHANPELLYPNDPHIIALLTDSETIQSTRDLTVLDLNNTAQIVDFILNFIGNRND